MLPIPHAPPFLASITDNSHPPSPHRRRLLSTLPPSFVCSKWPSMSGLALCHALLHPTPLPVPNCLSFHKRPDPTNSSERGKRLFVLSCPPSPPTSALLRGISLSLETRVRCMGTSGTFFASTQRAPSEKEVSRSSNSSCRKKKKMLAQKPPTTSPGKNPPPPRSRRLACEVWTP